MDRNLGDFDRWMRVGVGSVMLLMAMLGPRSVFGLLGVLPLVIGLTGFDPIYEMLHLNTRPAFVRGRR